jgi:hypothetical protein
MNNSDSCFIDIAVESIHKYKEELCGDHVAIKENQDSKIIVLSDGLGSGVKANILSTLTSTIAASMLQHGANLIEVLETLEKTLPECKVRGLAYSTFTIIQLFNNGQVYIVEFDNPKIVYLRDGALFQLEESSISFKGKEIKEYKTTYQKGDIISCFSDGVIHTGIGKYIYLGWQWDEVVRSLIAISNKSKSAIHVAKEIIDICNVFSDYEPGDDTTCLVIKFRDKETINLFSGPPKEPSIDSILVSDFMQSKGKKVVCGGTAANIVARELNEEINTDISNLDSKVPPYAQINGLDLVTEGVLTIRETISILEDYKLPTFSKDILYRDNGASKLARLLIDECTHLDVFIGNAINPAHQNPFFPDDLNIKWKTTNKLIETVRSLGKVVQILQY